MENKINTSRYKKKLNRKVAWIIRFVLPVVVFCHMGLCSDAESHRSVMDDRKNSSKHNIVRLEMHRNCFSLPNLT